MYIQFYMNIFNRAYKVPLHLLYWLAMQCLFTFNIKIEYRRQILQFIRNISYTHLKRELIKGINKWKLLLLTFRFINLICNGSTSTLFMRECFPLTYSLYAILLIIASNVHKTLKRISNYASDTLALYIFWINANGLSL